MDACDVVSVIVQLIRVDQLVYFGVARFSVVKFFQTNKNLIKNIIENYIILRHLSILFELLLISPFF